MTTLDSVWKQVVKAQEEGNPLTELKFKESELIELLAEQFPNDNLFELKRTAQKITTLYGILVVLEDDNVATE